MGITLIDQFLDPVAELLTPAVAQKIVGLKAPPELQAQVDDLADKANRGVLTGEERTEYDRILAAYHFVSVLQARARHILQK